MCIPFLDEVKFFQYWYTVFTTGHIRQMGKGF